MQSVSSYLTDEEIEAYKNELARVKVQCSCGHKVVMPHWVDKQICTWCKRYVFRNKQDEFKYRMKEKLK